MPLSSSTPASKLVPSPPSSSNPKTVSASSISSMTSYNTSKPNKKKRFRGWVCEDEVSEGETAILKKLETCGREFPAGAQASKIRYNPRGIASPTGTEPSSSTTVGRFSLRRRKTIASEAAVVTPSKTPMSPSISTVPRIQGESKGKKQLSNTTKMPDTPQSNPPRASAHAHAVFEGGLHPSKTGDEQPLKKKPRFRGYVCEDEVEERDPILADVIRQRGTPFEVKEAAAGQSLAPKPSVNSLKDRKKTHTFTQFPVSHPPLAAPFENSHATTTKSGHSGPDSIKYRPSKRNSEPPPPKKKQKVYHNQYLPPNKRAQLLFPNLARDPRSGSSTTASHLPTPPTKVREKPAPMARAHQIVRESTQNLKHMTALADQTARAAAEAKRKAIDAGNQLEEAKRYFRTESEKERARLEGRKYTSGWVWVDKKADEEGRAGIKRVPGVRDSHGAKIVGEKRSTKQHDREKVENEPVVGTGVFNDRVEEYDEDEEDDDYETQDEDEDEDTSSSNDENDDNAEGASDTDSEGGYPAGRTADLLG